MRIAFWAVSLAFLAAPACPAPPKEIALPMGGALRVSTSGETTRFEWRSASGRRGVVRVTRDEHVAPQSPPAKVEIVAQTEKAVVLTDTYRSRPGGMSYCQAGEERFLRVLSMQRDLAETLRLKLASCRENLELADPGIEWDATSSVLRIHWLPGAAAGRPTARIVRIGADGKPVER